MKKSGVDYKLGRYKTSSYIKGPMLLLPCITIREGVTSSELGMLHCIVTVGFTRQCQSHGRPGALFLLMENGGKWELGGVLQHPLVMMVFK